MKGPIMGKTGKAGEEVVPVGEKNTTVVGYDYGDDAGDGFQGTTQDDLSIPFLNILQKGSPEVEDQTIEGAQEGDILNSVTKELIKAMDKDAAGLIMVPCHKETGYVEWVKRDNGGGFVGKHKTDSDIVAKAIKKNGGSKFGGLETDEGNDLVETVEIFGLILNDEGTEVEGFGVLTLTSTKLKAAKDWYTAMFSIKGKPPIYANRARIKTFKDSNKKGKFANITVSPLRGTWKESLINPAEEGALIKAAKDFRDMVLDGSAKADYASQESEGGQSKEGEEKEVF